MRNAVLALWLFACGGAVPDDGGTGAVARFAPRDDDGALDWGAVPFPSNLYLDSAGHPRIGALPTRASSAPRFTALRDLLALRNGFCGTCNVYFGIDGAIDFARLPPSASPSDSASFDDAIVMVDVDPDSPEHGRLIPLRVEYNASVGAIAVRPVRGIVLRRFGRYAVALTSSIRSANGAPLAPSPAFVEVREGRGDAPGVVRARVVLGAALEDVVAMGVARDRIVDFTVFTVEDPTLDLRYARAALAVAPPPTATVDQVWSDPADIDALLGVPSEDRPGIDVPPLAGTEGTRSLRHASVEVIVSGRFTAPRFVTGIGTDIGSPRYDADGTLTAGELEDVPFVLIVPVGADITNLPVLVHQHGFNASRITGFVLADTAGRAGCAVLSIDAYQHGERALVHQDLVHNMRGSPGADGFAETDMLGVSGRVFGITDVPAGMELFGGYPLGAFLQFAADAMSAVRLVRVGDISAIQSADQALRRLAFDPTRVLYAGNSMGAVVGASVLTAESDVGAFVLNVQPGSMIETLSEGAEFRALSESVFLPLLGVPAGFDDVTRSVVFEPMVDFLRWAMEPVDPLALAPYLLLDPLAPGPRPDVLVQLAGLDEVAAPSASQSMMAAAGMLGIGTFDIVPLPSAVLPLSANFTTPNGVVTAGVQRFDPASHGMLEVRDQQSRYEPPLVPPFVARPTPIPVANPIVEIHAQIETFLRTRIETGRAAIQ